MSKREEVLQFLDDLDSLNTSSLSSFSKPNAPTVPSTSQPANEAEALAFLDEITQKSSQPTRTTTVPTPHPRTVTPRTSSRISLRKGAEGVSRSASPAPRVVSQGQAISASGSSSADTTAEVPSTSGTSSNAGGTWGWSSVWSSASAAVKQARNVVDEQVKNLPKNEQAMKWSEGMIEYVKNAQLEKLGHDIKAAGLSTFTDILNVVAPPISEHEVIEVWLSHDMKGYEGIESLVYQALAKVMEQVEGGDLVINKGDESRPKDVAAGRTERDLGVAECFDAGYKLAKANIEELIKNNAQKHPTRSSSITNPTTYSAVYLRVQPYFTSIPPAPSLLPDESPSSSRTPHTPTHLQFLLYLSSPSHSLTHTTVTQAVPSRWVDALQEDEAGDGHHMWVDDVLVDVLRVGVEVIGQDYLSERMGWAQRTSSRESTTPPRGQTGITEKTNPESRSDSNNDH